MELFSALSQLTHLLNLAMLLLGVFLGIILGSIPGIGASAALAIFLPFTFGLPVEAAIILLLSIYAAAEYGGSISAIAVNAPGTGGAAATLLDGYPLTRKGQPGKALSTSLFASVTGGFMSAIILMLLTPPLARLGLKFGPAEMFSLIMCGLAIIASLSSDSLIKGGISAGIGLLVATVGIDPFTGFARYTFNLPELQGGIKPIPDMIGVFALAEAFRMLERAAMGYDKSDADKLDFSQRINFKEYWGLKKTIFRGGLIGVLIGIIPGVGASVASFIAYDTERKISKNPEDFGKGKFEGIAAPEAANNAVVGGALVPAIALGIPGSASIAILLGALIMNGITPGPYLLENNKDLVYLIFIVRAVDPFIILVAGLFTIKITVGILKVSKRTLAPVIIAMTVLGSYVYAFSYIDVLTMFGFGVLGWVFGKIEVPVVPLVIAHILGGLAERNLLGALIISQGDPLILVRKPISLVLLLVAVTSFTLALKFGGSRKKRK